jgi:hypothetical protein
MKHIQINNIKDFDYILNEKIIINEEYNNELDFNKEYEQNSWRINFGKDFSLSLDFNDLVSFVLKLIEKKK